MPRDFAINQEKCRKSQKYFENFEMKSLYLKSTDLIFLQELMPDA